MSKNFWNTIQRPIMALAPMEDVTDTVFRELITSLSEPGCLNVLMTEFVSTDGLCHDLGKDRVIHRLHVTESERKLNQERGIKLVAQIWGTNPENYQKATKMLLEDFNFDGIDINMGCPVPKIIKKGACSGLINTPSLAQEIIAATKEAANGLPVSVKTRLGVNEVITEKWIEKVLEADPAAISLHGRIQKQMSEGKADWNEIGKAARLRDAMGKDIPIIGNGDVRELQEAYDKVEEFGLDGVMVGRGIFHNPWLFRKEMPDMDPVKRMLTLWRHTCMFRDTWQGRKNFQILRRFYKCYASNFNGAAPTRAKLMETRNIDDVEKVLRDIGVLEGNS